MSNVVTIAPHSAAGEYMTPAALRAKLSVITETMKSVMKKDDDYGKIPGTQRPTLLQPGAQKLCALFGIATTFLVEDLSTSDCMRYRVTCTGRARDTGMVLGEGLGECSTNEDKYKWRSSVCAQEFDETPEDMRRKKWKRGGNKPYVIHQVRNDPADQANTVLKMAKKRAHISMTLDVTGASSVFTQDMEDSPRPDNVDDDGVITTERKPRQTQQQPVASPINSDQLRMLLKKMDDAGMPAEQLCKRFNIQSANELQFSDLNAALAYVADPQMNESRS